MISDEVLDSIQILRFFHDKCNSEKSIGMMQVYRVDELAKAIESILNFIEKQQKEIEDLKEKIKNFTIEDENIYLQFGEITEKKRWKDKIKAKIEEIEKELEDIELKSINKDEISKTTFYFIDRLKCKIDVLQLLLEKE